MQSPPRADRLVGRAMVALWIVTLPLMLVGLGGPDVSRTQEARVLETAREMPGSGWRQGWIIPHLNGRVRLEKPPLAYWMAAGSYRLLGVSEAAGRLPFALCNWLTLAVVYRAGRWMAMRITGALAAALLMGSYMFTRYGRMAETDGPAMLFVTLAIYLLWRSAGFVNPDRSDSRASPSALSAPRFPIVYDHLAAAAAGLAFNVKQGGVIYPLVFLVLIAAVERRWRWLGRFVLSGAPVTLIVFAAPWYATAIGMMGFQTFWKEARDVAGGRDHPGTPLLYIPWLLKATAPWCGLLALAVVQGGRRFRSEPAARGLLVWMVAVLLPLCFAGNKQDHYLIPVLPPAMLLTAWLVAGVPVSRDTEETRIFDAVGVTTVAVVAVIGAAVPVIARLARGELRAEDMLFCAALVLLAVVTLALWRRRGRSALAVPILALPAVMPALLGIWLPSLAPRDHRTLAAAIRAGAGPGPYCFYGPNESFPLVFMLRSIVPQYETESALRAALEREPWLTVIAQTKNMTPPPPLPGGLTQVAEERIEDQVVRVYRHHTSGGSSAADASRGD